MIGFGVNPWGCAEITVQDPLRLVAEAKKMVDANPELWTPRVNNITYCVYETLRRAGFRPVQRGPLHEYQNEPLYYYSWIRHQDSASESGRAAASKKPRSVS
jgi:hypothetical protein